MKQLELNISDLSSLNAAAVKLLEFSGKNKILVFEAEMGAGKTTLIKQLSKALGSEDNFSSPTYAIVNEYTSPNGKLFHFDLYRLKNREELFDIGFEDYVTGANYCFIEWPQLAEDFLPRPYVLVRIKVNENNRYLSAQIIE